MAAAVLVIVHYRDLHSAVSLAFYFKAGWGRYILHGVLFRREVGRSNKACGTNITQRAQLIFLYLDNLLQNRTRIGMSGINFKQRVLCPPTFTGFAVLGTDI